MARPSPTAVLVAVVTLVAVAVTAVAVVSAGGRDAAIVVALVGTTVTPTVVGLMALLRTQEASAKLDDVAAKVNGQLTGHVEDAVARAVHGRRPGDRAPRREGAVDLARREH